MHLHTVIHIAAPFGWTHKWFLSLDNLCYRELAAAQIQRTKCRVILSPILSLSFSPCDCLHTVCAEARSKDHKCDKWMGKLRVIVHIIQRRAHVSLSRTHTQFRRWNINSQAASNVTRIYYLFKRCSFSSWVRTVPHGNRLAHTHTETHSRMWSIVK